MTLQHGEQISDPFRELEGCGLRKKYGGSNGLAGRGLIQPTPTDDIYPVV